MDNDKNTQSKISLTIELIMTAILRHKIIIIASFAFIIAVVVGISIFQMSIESADKTANKDFQEALYNYELIARMDASNPQTTQIVIDVITRLKKVEKEAKSKGLKLRASYALANVYYDVKNYIEAEKYYKNVTDNRRFYLAENAMFNLANNFVQQKKYDEAVSTLDNLKQYYNKGFLNPEATLLLADIYILQNKRSEALNTLKNWIQNNEDNQVYGELIIETMALIENNIY